MLIMKRATIIKPNQRTPPPSKPQIAPRAGAIKSSSGLGAGMNPILASCHLPVSSNPMPVAIASMGVIMFELLSHWPVDWNKFMVANALIMWM
jgi:hypothetical protein